MMKTNIAMGCFLLILSFSMNVHSNNAAIALTEEPKMPLIKLATENEEDAIKKRIIAETVHYFARDMISWRACFVHNDKTAIIQKYANGEQVSVVGFSEMEARTNKAWEENPDMDFKAISRLQWNISINGNVAWVNFKQNALINGTERPSEEIRVLVKENDTWKIALISSIF